MSEFTPIETQEAFDAAIGERLKRERETQEKKYSSYISPDDFESKKKEYETTIGTLNADLKTANDKIAGHEKELAERDAKIKSYESHSVKSRIAHENELPYEAVEFLKGETEEEIKKSAADLKAIMGQRGAAPLASTEKGGKGNGDEALRALISRLKEKQ